MNPAWFTAAKNVESSGISPAVAIRFCSEVGGSAKSPLQAYKVMAAINANIGIASAWVKLLFNLKVSRGLISLIDRLKIGN